MRLKDKVALITGAAISMVGIPASSVQAQADSLLRAGHRARAIPADVSDAQQVQQTVKAFGCLDNAVACAAVYYHNRDFTLDALDESVWEETHAVNLRGVMLTCKSSIGHMLD